MGQLTQNLKFKPSDENVSCLFDERKKILTFKEAKSLIGKKYGFFSVSTILFTQFILYIWVQIYFFHYHVHYFGLFYDLPLLVHKYSVSNNFPNYHSYGNTVEPRYKEVGYNMNPLITR